MSRHFNPLPACPIPIQWDVAGRIKELQAIIDDPTTSEDQKTNLRAAIDLYDNGELPGSCRMIQDGKVVELKYVDFTRAWWAEERPIDFMIKDETIITTAIPRITDDFKTINHIGWYGSA
ncbi:hypothetical protein PRK78_005755 [Emydomyces testavorans]|uniref:Uncharacterized protein n=1 Tax=Emydomyces testavorans TaxID=2070801 RepID=A0AAF0DK81_9EURO|nr:hypothetical protein PRK78_005755 [Emydomyces testavorans]